MKRSITFIFFIAILSMNTQQSYSGSCCSQVSSTVRFASLTKSSSFRAAHPNPRPFTLSAQQGTMIEFTCEDSKSGLAYEVKANVASNKYVFMIHEWWGLNDYIKQEADKLQHELGDVNVIALDLYDGNVATSREQAAKLMSGVNEERVRNIIQGAIKYAGTDARICTIGWCFGGGWSLQTTLMLSSKAAGCVMYYGMPESDDKKLATLTVPVLGVFAKKDKWITVDVVKKFEQQMKSANKSLAVRSYDADHAFANPSNPQFNKEFTEDAHNACVEFFRTRFK